MNKPHSPLLLGIDIGTGGAKAALVTPEGEVVGKGYSHYLVNRPAEGYAEQDPEADWWQGCGKAVSSALLDAKANPHQIIALGCSAQTPNVALIDREGQALRPAIIWQDTRSVSVAERLNTALVEAGIWSNHHPPLTAHSFGAPLLWLRENEPGRCKQAHLCLTTPGYLHYRLVGNTAVDRAIASGMLPFYSLYLGDWDHRVCAALSVDCDELPQISHSNMVLGALLPRAAEELGLPDGIPVVVGTADSMADLLSAGVISPGHAAFTYGTLFGLMKCIDKPIPDSFCFAHAIEGVYLLCGGIPLAGATLGWFRDQLALVEQERAENSGENVYDLLNALAESIPPNSEGLLALPFSDQPASDGHFPIGAALVGMGLRHTRGHIYRAFLEGIAYEARRQLERMPGPPIEEAVAMGGGSQNRLWMQIVSDVTGVKQRIPLHYHGAPVGAAYLAGWGVGLFDGLEQLTAHWLGHEETITPDTRNSEIYQEGYSCYMAVRSRLGIPEFP